MSDRIFHLAEPGEWARSTDTYSPAGLEAEGFIHCSTSDQLHEVARRLYGDHNDLILLTVDPSALEPGVLVFESAEDTDQPYPHVYGPLPTAAVVSTGPYLEHLEEGLWLESRFDRGWMERILHPAFAEVGMSGRTYTRDETLDIPEQSLVVRLPHEDYRLDLVDDDVAMARYLSHETLAGVTRKAHRTSIWVNTNQGWRLRFHQGTPAGDP